MQRHSGSVPRQTRIVATLGICRDESWPLFIDTMFDAGTDIFRINFSHASSDYASESEVLSYVHGKLEKDGELAAVLGDLQGPKVRIGEIAEPGLELVDDAVLTMRIEGGAGEIPMNRDVGEAVLRAVDGHVNGSGQEMPIIVFGDGDLMVKAEEILADGLKVRVLAGGILTSRKGLAIRGVDVDMDAFPEKDQRDLRFCLEKGADFVAVSFVRSAEDIIRVKKFIREHLGDKEHLPSVIAKIETLSGLKNIDSILRESDGIMIARGDLGLQIGVEAVPRAQKDLIGAARAQGKPTIVATQMLESMIKNPTPTRAEATDVFNAISDGCDAVMLSGETSVGVRPSAAVKTMDRIARMAESHARDSKSLRRNRKETRARMGTQVDTHTIGRVNEDIALMAVEFAERIPAHAVLSFTRTGATPRRMSHYRPGIPLIGACWTADLARSLLVHYAVHPVIMPKTTADPRISDLVALVRPSLREKYGLEPGAAVVVTGSIDWRRGGTNTIRVVVEDIKSFEEAGDSAS